MWIVEYQNNKYGKLSAFFDSIEDAEEFFDNNKRSVLILNKSGLQTILKVKAEKGSINRIFHHYEKWEDYQNGMYRNVKASEKAKHVQNAAFLLSAHKHLFYAMKRVIDNWIIASEFNLSNISCNRRAWLGWSACCIRYNVPEYLTREAWNTLTPEVQTRANNIADEVIKIWEQKHLIENIAKCQK